MTNDDKTRKGEKGKIPNRKPRVFERNGAWFFATREGASIGPFDSRVAAKQQAQDYADNASEP